MEQPEKNKRKYSGIKRRRQLESTSSLPTDLTTEILLRLPEKSVARFRCVSNLWSSITTDPYFINSYETRFPRPSLLLCVIKDDNLFVSSIPEHQSSNRSYSSSLPINSYHMKFPGLYCGPRTESVHGLICFLTSEKSPIVWNPSKRQMLTLPKPDKSWTNIDLLLGYDPIEGKHKVVCLNLKYGKCDVCQVLTLGSAQKSWRYVNTYHKHLTSSRRAYGICIKGFIYYKAYISETGLWIIIRFDVRSENFGMIDLPSNIYVDMLVNYKGRLACATRKNQFRLWVLEDAKKYKWSSQDFLAPLLTRDREHTYPYGMTHAGESIYIPCKFPESAYILICDPVRNSYRRIEFKFWLNNVVQNMASNYGMCLFPNHIESQMSF